MNDVTIFGGLPTGGRLEGEPDRPAGVIGILQAATAELCDVLRRNVREIPENQLERLDGGRFWIDTETGEELELLRGHVDPIAPADAGCIAFAVRDNLVVPFKARGYRGLVSSVSLGSLSGGPATGGERVR